MSFDYQIKADPSPALQAVDRVDAAHGRVEGSAKRVGGAIDQAFRSPALRDAEGRLLATGAAAERAAGQLRGMAAAANAAATATDAAAKSASDLVRGRDARGRYLSGAGGPISTGGPAPLLASLPIGINNLSAREAALAAERQMQMLRDAGVPIMDRYRRARQASNELGLGGSMPMSLPPPTAPPLAPPPGVRDAAAAAGGPGGAGGGGTSALGTAAAMLRSGAGMLGIGVGLQQIQAMNEQYQVLQNRLRQLVPAGGSVSTMMRELGESATRARSSIGPMVEAFVRIRQATKEMGISNEEALLVTERISKAIKVSGADAGSAAAASLQLSQALASGRLQGDEFRSVMENASYVLEVVAKSMGVSIGKLREMSTQGKITSEVLVAAFTTAGKKIDEDFAKTVPTAGEQLAMLKDRVMLTVGGLVEATGIIGTITNVLKPVLTVFSAMANAVTEVTKRVRELGEALGPVASVIKMILSPFDMLIEAADYAGDRITELAAASNADAIAAQKRAQAYLNLIEAMKKLDLEEIKIDKTATVVAAANTANANDVTKEQIGYNADLARQLAQVRIAAGQVGFTLADAYGDANQRATELAKSVEKLDEQEKTRKLAEEAERTRKAMLGINDAIVAQTQRSKALRDSYDEAQGAFEKRRRDRYIGFDRTGQLQPIDANYVEAQRAYEDAQLKINEAFGQYGKLVVDVKQAEVEHKRKIEDVQGAYAEGKLTIAQYAEQLRSLGADIKTKDWKQIAELNKVAQQAAQDAVDELRTLPQADLKARAAEYTAAQRDLEDASLRSTFATKQYGEVILRAKAGTLEHKRALDDVKGAYATGALTAKEYADELRRLGVEEGFASKLLKERADNAKALSSAITGLNALFKLGKIDAYEYNRELNKIAAANPVEEGKQPRGVRVGPRRFGKEEIAIGVDEAPPPLQLAPRSLGELGTAAPAGFAFERAHNEVIERKRAIMEGLDGPQTRYREQVTALNELLKEGAITQTEYNRLLAESRGGLDQAAAKTAAWNKEGQALEDRSSFGKGIIDGLNGIKNEMLNVSSLASSTMMDAFRGLEGAIVGIATTGKLSFGEFFQAMEKDLAMLALRILEMAALKAIFGGSFSFGGGGGGGKGGGAAATAAGAAGAILGGAFADGGTFVVPGSGGPDSQNVMFKLTPGERVDFTPPGSAPRGAGATHVHIHDDPRALIPVVEGRDGQRAVVSIVRRNRGAVRSILRQ